MAKKKKKRPHRRPVAPPVHSAPDTVHAPPTRPAEAFAARPSSPEPPVAGEPLHDAPVFEPAPAPSRSRKPPAPRRGSSRRRRRNRSRYTIAALVVVALLAALVGWQVSNRSKASSYDKLAASAGCGKVRTIGDLSRNHTADRDIRYKTSPPVGGSHNPTPLNAGVYQEPFSREHAKAPSIYQAVHSLEHGYVIVWYNGLKQDDIDTLSRTVTGEPEVILVPYPEMPGSNKMALTAWGRLEYCSKPSTRVVDAFIERFRNARSAPESFNK